jgi:EmrB/QacA subfamily drug resistance transporter
MAPELDLLAHAGDATSDLRGEPPVGTVATPMTAPVRQHYNLTLAILTTAGTAFALQQTMVFPALTTFQHEFNTTPAWATWVLTAFLLTASVATPLIGKLGDQYGKERMLVVALSIFLLGTIGGAFAWNIGSLIAFRALSGAGGAVFPLSFGIIRDEFPPEKVKVGIGLLSAVFGVGGGFGIVLSGVIVDHLSWRWLFVAGAIPVAVTIFLVHRYVPESPIKSRTRVDIPGAVLLAGALVSLLVALTEGESWGWTSPPFLLLMATSAVLLVIWIVTELRVAEPMVDMRMMQKRPVLLTNTTALIAGFAMFGTFVLVPQFVSTPESSGYGFGASPTVAGLYLVPASAVMLFSGPVAGVLGRLYGSKWPLAVGMGLVAVAAAGLAAFHDTPAHLIVSMAVLGAGVAAAFAAMAALITESVRPTETGIATGMNTVMRTVGGVIGGQIGAAILTSYTLASGLPDEKAYTIAFGLSAAAAAAASGVAVFITAPLRARRRAQPAEALD